MNSEIVKIIMERDGISLSEALSLLQEARAEVQDGADPQGVLEEYFGLEPDYMLELLW